MKLLNLFQSKSKKVKHLIPMLPIILSTSCVSEPEVKACPQLPVALTAHLDKTPFSGRTYGDVTQYAVVLKRERDMCLNRIDKIRE
ncbi:Rz1-like lysis system protein LysC [Basfia succiniciproducens]